jgi:hypothetical protein
MTYQQLRELAEQIDEALAVKQGEAEREYRAKAAELAASYGFRVMAKMGRPKKRAPLRRDRKDSGNGHDTGLDMGQDEGVGAAG